MLTDAGAIGLSLWAARLALRPARGSMTYGLPPRRDPLRPGQRHHPARPRRADRVRGGPAAHLAATVNARLILAIALVGIAVNLAATWVLAKADRQSLNVEGSFQHILTDLYAFVGTAIAAGVILATGFERADPIASLFVAALMLYAAYGLLKASGRIFLEAAPEGIDVGDVGQALAEQPGWSRCTTCTSGRSPPASPPSPHTCWSGEGELPRHPPRPRPPPARTFQLTHTTLQVDHRQEALVEITSGRIHRRGRGGAH